MQGGAAENGVASLYETGASLAPVGLVHCIPVCVISLLRNYVPAISL
ncbi:unnamed protein product [Ixodes persulcatus]